MARFPAVSILFLLTLFPLSAAADDCAPVLQAMVKGAFAPNITTTSYVLAGRPHTTIAIETQTLRYVPVAGGWHAIKRNPDYEAGQIMQRAQKLKDNCRYTGDQMVGKEPATTFEMQNALDRSAVMTRYWISKSSGLPLKQVVTIKGQPTTSVISYTNVKAPSPLR
jgi:hypothetical protein